MVSPLFVLPLLRNYFVQTKSDKSTRWQKYDSFATLNLAERTARELASQSSSTHSVRIFNQITGQVVRVYEVQKTS